MRLPLATAGQRDCFVTVESVTRSIGPSRQPVETWAQLGDDGVWMAKKAQAESGRFSEQFVAGQLSAQAYTEWSMPYQETMDPDVVDVPKDRRLNYRGRIYDIVRADALGRQRAILLTTLAKVG